MTSDFSTSPLFPTEGPVLPDLCHTGGRASRYDEVTPDHCALTGEAPRTLRGRQPLERRPVRADAPRPEANLV